MFVLDFECKGEAIAAVERSVNAPLKLDNGWNAWGIKNTLANKSVGGILVKGNEIHVGITDPIFARGIIRQLFAELFKTHDRIRTKVRESNTKGIRFVERLGFVRCFSESGIIWYEMKKGSNEKFIR